MSANTSFYSILDGVVYVKSRNGDQSKICEIGDYLGLCYDEELSLIMKHGEAKAVRNWYERVGRAGISSTSLGVQEFAASMRDATRIIEFECNQNTVEIINKLILTSIMSPTLFKSAIDQLVSAASERKLNDMLAITP